MNNFNILGTSQPNYGTQPIAPNYGNQPNYGLNNNVNNGQQPLNNGFYPPPQNGGFPVYYQNQNGGLPTNNQIPFNGGAPVYYPPPNYNPYMMGQPNQNLYGNQPIYFNPMGNNLNNQI